MPHMRLIHEDRELLELTFEILLYCSRQINVQPSERVRIEQFYELMITRFYKLSFVKILKNSKCLKPATDKDLQVLQTIQSYF